MDQDLIKQIALEVMNETFITNWYFYLLLLCVSTIGAFFGSLLKGFGKEKSKYLAIESSLETIAKQVKLTTETSEQIKTAIEHNVWRKKELETLKREKLEQYFLHISLLNNSLNNEMISTFFGEKVEHDPESFTKADMIQSLYLPELLEVHLELSKVVIEFQTWISDGLFIIASQSKAQTKDPTLMQAHMKKQPILLKKLANPIVNVLQKTKELALEVNT
ncbi:hypothetical protein [Moritella sp. Urea-trap-13]|uniref:hypothetical protein n=1 Tax=Moritella sp. Urea-trap-13 TaxID=2058327 RepID=UPI000C33F0B7|nr:hypothetical protein [Moritella sp. Urea-trap-13]PKH05962.1 hypothetical protein CXF93_08460 [Moritella sp. Urea-trap-13]